MNADLQSRLEKILAEPVKSTTSVSGGCIADSRKLELNSGKLFFLKLARRRNSGMFDSEAQGLEEVGKNGAVSVPGGGAEEKKFLLLGWGEGGGGRDGFRMGKRGF